MSSCRQWRGSRGGCGAVAEPLARATVPAAGPRTGIAAGVWPCLQPSSPLPAPGCKKQQAGDAAGSGSPAGLTVGSVISECHSQAVFAVAMVPGLGHPPEQPQPSSPAFPVLFWPLAVKAVTAQLTSRTCPLAWQEWDWDFWVPQPRCSHLLLGRSTARDAAGRGK